MKKINIILFLIIPIGLYCQEMRSPIISTFCGLTDGYINQTEISNKDSIIIFINDCKYSTAKVKSFFLSAKSQEGDIAILNPGNKFSEESLIILRSVVPLSTFYIEDIKIIIDSIPIKTNDIKVKLDGLKTCIFSNFSQAKYKYNPCLDTILQRTVWNDPICEEGRISKKTLLMNDYLFVANPRKEFNDYAPVNASFQITSYTMTFYDWEEHELFTINESGDFISKKIKKIIRNNKNIEQIVINNVQALNNSKQIVKIGGLWLKIE